MRMGLRSAPPWAESFQSVGLKRESKAEADTAGVSHPGVAKESDPVTGRLTNSNATRHQAGWEESLFLFKSERP